MPDLTKWVSGADFIEMGEFLAEEGSNFGKVLVVYPLLRFSDPSRGRRQSEAHLNSFATMQACAASRCEL